jgi:hypothetical protein
VHENLTVVSIIVRAMLLQWILLKIKIDYILNYIYEYKRDNRNLTEIIASFFYEP